MIDTPEVNSNGKEATNGAPFLKLAVNANVVNVLELEPEVEDATLSDLEEIEVILRQRVRDSEKGKILEGEIAEILKGIKESIEKKQEKKYIVAKVGGKIKGVVGMLWGDDRAEKMKKFADIELNNFYVLDDNIIGVGKLLLEAFEFHCNVAPERLELPQADGFALNSGPRYKQAWGFYNHMLGESVDELRHYYGVGNHAPVWVKKAKKS